MTPTATPHFRWPLTATGGSLIAPAAHPRAHPCQAGALNERWSSAQGFFVENLFVVACETVADMMAVRRPPVRLIGPSQFMRELTAQVRISEFFPTAEPGTNTSEFVA